MQLLVSCNFANNMKLNIMYVPRRIDIHTKMIYYKHWSVIVLSLTGGLLVYNSAKLAESVLSYKEIYND